MSDNSEYRNVHGCNGGQIKHKEPDYVIELRAKLAEAQKEIEFRDKWLNQWQLKTKEAIDRCKKNEAENAALQTQLTKAQVDIAELDESESSLIKERDYYEEVTGNVAAILGCHDEWTSSHDHRQCIVELAETIRERAEKAEADNAALRERLQGIEDMVIWIANKK